jgi:serine/threonine protein kinase
MRAPHAPPLVPPGYRVLECLGTGAFGTVHRALHVDLGRMVALKMHRPEKGALALKRFVREAQVLARMNHPRILRIFDFGVYGDQGFLATELLGMGSLRTVIQKIGAVPAKHAVRLALEVLDALSYVHALGVVHRDIKPDNVLLDDRGRARVADFGLAQVDGLSASPNGEPVGTVHYMAPEVLFDVEFSPAGDVYATGVLLLELLTGGLGMPGIDLKDLLEMKKDGSLVARLARETPLPPGLQPVLERATAPDRAVRYASALEFSLALRRAVAPSHATRTGYKVTQRFARFAPPSFARTMASAMWKRATSLWAAVAA